MKEKWLKLAGEFLDRAADDLSNHNCNDWKWPTDWSHEECKELAIAMTIDNCGKEDKAAWRNLCRGKFGPPDWWVARFLAKQLMK